MMQSISLRAEWRTRPAESAAVWGMQTVLRPMQVLIMAPCLLFLMALTAMLLRHPDVAFYEIDRVAFGVLVVGVVGRALVERQPLLVIERATWPMIGLTLLALASLAGQPFDQEAWSLLAAKLIVPFTLFHLARLIFTKQAHFRQFEFFSLIVLAYLSFTAIAFLVGARSLIFPRYILDESLGHHADRARGPLLQAVANGVSLNLLALLVLHACRRGSLGKFKCCIVLASVPVAILATMTRAVWLTFAATIAILVWFSNKQWLKRLCLGLVPVAGLSMMIVLSSSQGNGALADRLEERGPVDYRWAVYTGGWQMFLERPLTGWGFHSMPTELPRYVVGYNEKQLYPHNTYLEVLVEEGILGLALHFWLMWELWRAGRGAVPAGEKHGFLNRDFHRLWPILLGVYWLNAVVVVMSYQFVNGLVFTMAGMLAAQRRRAEAFALC